MTDRSQMEAVVEAILFVANDPVPRGKLLEVFSEQERPAASEALDAVLERYREHSARGIMVDEVAGGLRLVSRPDLHGYLRRFFEVTGSNKLSMPALESLAIVAYRQPVTAPEIQELRGVNSSGVLKKLLERRMIRIAGRKEVVGKPFLYATTREFLQHFGLKSLKELPPLEQFEELFGGDVEAAPETMEPDPEEQVDQEVAVMEEQQDEAMERAEAQAIEDERIAAEEAEEVADLEDSASSGEPEAVDVGATPASPDQLPAVDDEAISTAPEEAEITGDAQEADAGASPEEPRETGDRATSDSAEETSDAEDES